MALAPWLGVAGDHARGGYEVLGGILRADTRLHGPAADNHAFLVKGQRFAAGYAQLQGHQIQAGDQLGDRVLHLQACVHLKEIEAALRIQHELHGAGIHITGFSG